MKRTDSNRQVSLRQVVVAVMLHLAVVALAIAVPTVGAAAPEQEQQENGRTTGLIGIVPGQTARLAVWNKGKENIVVQFRFVDEQGKVLIQCDSFVEAGKAEMQDFHHPGGVNRFEFQAQFGTNSARQIGLLVPTLQIIGPEIIGPEQTGATSWMLGPEDFAGFRLVPVPDLLPLGF